MLAACREAGATGGDVLRHTNSYETLADVAPQDGEKRHVGYAAVGYRMKIRVAAEQHGGWIVARGHPPQHRMMPNAPSVTIGKDNRDGQPQPRSNANPGLLGPESMGLLMGWPGRGTVFVIDWAERNLCGPWEQNMNEQEFQSKLAELMTEISTLPVTERKKLEQLADERDKGMNGCAPPSAAFRKAWTTSASRSNTCFRSGSGPAGRTAICARCSKRPERQRLTESIKPSYSGPLARTAGVLRMKRSRRRARRLLRFFITRREPELTMRANPSTSRPSQSTV